MNDYSKYAFQWQHRHRKLQVNAAQNPICYIGVCLSKLIMDDLEEILRSGRDEYVFNINTKR